MPIRPETATVWHLLKQLLIFPRGLLGGLVAATLMWTVVIFYNNWHVTRNARKMGLVGASATAGGWQYLVQLPPVVVLLSVAFRLGFYVVVSWVARHP